MSFANNLLKALVEYTSEAIPTLNRKTCVHENIFEVVP